MTSVSVLNPAQSGAQIVSVETDFDIYKSNSSNSIQMDFRPNLEDITYLVVTLNKSSSSVVLPKTVQLAVYACTKPVTIRTKAQLELRKYRNQFIHLIQYFF